MLAVAALLLTHTFVQGPVVPVLWLSPSGEIFVGGEPVEPKFNSGAIKVKTPFGQGYDFSGEKSGILFGDKQPLRLNGDMTMSVWIFPRAYAPNGAQSEVLFRGDDRNGFDPYCLVLEQSGDLVFHICDDKDQNADVREEIGLNRWTHVVASLNNATGELTMYANGIKVTSSITPKRPLMDLIEKYTPGVGVGNVQNDKGPHNQPFNGIIADLRLYNKCLTPPQAGYAPKHFTTGATP